MRGPSKAPHQVASEFYAGREENAGADGAAASAAGIAVPMHDLSAESKLVG